MGFVDEIKNVLGLEDFSPCFKAVLFDDKGAYFENVSSVRCFYPDKIELCVKGGCVRICGENLSIKKYYGKDLAITGKILSVQRI